MSATMVRSSSSSSSLSSGGEKTSEKRNQQQAATKIGCMSGIFNLFQNHHHHILSRKRLTSPPESKGKNVISPSEATTPSPAADRNDTKTTKPPPEDPPSGPDLRRLSCDIPRSPTIPQEIRRSNSINSPEDFRRPPALMARLMGLDEMPSPSPSPKSSAEKRRKLLGALRKCDEDLKALKKIIEAVQMAGDRRRLEMERRRETLQEFVLGRRYKDRAGSEAPKDLDGGDSTTEEKRCSDVSAEQPSPVSVLDEISPSPLQNKSSNSPEKELECTAQNNVFGATVAASPTTADHRGYRLKDDMNGPFFHRITVESLPRIAMRKGGSPNERMSSPAQMTRRRSTSPCSKALLETVNEVLKDGIWGERWELGRVGVVLEGYIFRELVEEIVRELQCYFKWSLPFEACRKRLRF